MPLVKTPTVSCFSFFHPFWLLRRGLAQPQTDWIPVRVGDCEFPFPFSAGKDLYLWTPCGCRSSSSIVHQRKKGVAMVWYLPCDVYLAPLPACRYSWGWWELVVLCVKSYSRLNLENWSEENCAPLSLTNSFDIPQRAKISLSLFITSLPVVLDM